MTPVAWFFDFMWHDAFAKSNWTASYSLIVSLDHLTTWQMIASVVLAAILLTVVIEGWLLVHLIGRSGHVLLRLDAVESKIKARAALAASSPSSADAEGSAAVLELVYGEDSSLSRELNANVEPTITGVGEPVPQLMLPDINGRVVDLASLRGKNTLVLFWQSDCGHCRRMLPDLLAWEPDPPPDEPRLLIISSGSVEDNLSLGLHAPILVDHRFIAGRTFGASGTPSAVLIDAEGRIASRVVDGAPAVLALAGKIHMGPLETTPECESCLADCQNRGGGEACASLCAISGACD